MWKKVRPEALQQEAVGGERGKRKRKRKRVQQERIGTMTRSHEWGEGGTSDNKD
jgi:hypothetical protein